MAMLSTDWQYSKSLTKTYLYLFQKEIETDVEFMVGQEDKEIARAHSIIQAGRSPVFYAMFYGQMKEKDKIIPLPDIEPDSLKVFLTCLLYACTFQMIKFLKKICISEF